MLTSGERKARRDLGGVGGRKELFCEEKGYYGLIWNHGLLKTGKTKEFKDAYIQLKKVFNVNAITAG